MDVLSYNALNQENQKIRTSNAALDSCISTLNSQCQTYLSCIATNSPTIINGKVVRPEMWSYIPTGSDWTSGFKVCDTSGYFRCNACCAWTVPAGVTCARFQIWGAGGMSGSAGCCGGAPFGGSGAYASVIMPVQSGWAYTLCAGCAFCCYAGWNTTANQNGCSSFVTGCNLTNFCAMGGIGSICTEIIDRSIYYFVTNTIDAIPACTSLAYLGFCLCGTGSSFCSSAISTPYSGAGTLCCGSGFASEPHLMYQMYHSSATSYGTAVGGTVYGINGAYSEFCINPTCTCGYAKHPPVYGFTDLSQCVFEFNPASSSGGNLCSASATFGATTPSLQIPGAGGFAMRAYGGCVSICGDAGRMGMVCVSYK